ncbi:hypothetical protein BCIN_07g03630 [Botrytis cinerea B05.10]|nr:hypothetical protein BCIN_07g03630 [Botrytis cinerea B05.10]XP_024549796.1 hypothetical protein BCIN_07g03630 [Botrytis cinerea B05.10]ATZ51787.1 hypothetical protein BCIN_07g03630 [Botrytis cinerea B05.10]ATZ51788.1 hypothetical protein BCIN_07g03630 [Botrytis cinerea B05.10]
MAETSHRQTGSPSEDPSSPIITESQTPTSTDQPSADNKPSQEQSNIDSRVIDMEQDRNVAPLEEHSGGGFDPNGHYQDAYMNISKVTNGVTNAQSQLDISDTQSSSTGPNTRRNANKSGPGDGDIHRLKSQFQQHNDIGDEGHNSVLGRSRKGPRRYPHLFEGNSDGGELNPMQPYEMTHKAKGIANNFDRPSAGRNIRRAATRHPNRKLGSRNGLRVQDQSQSDIDSGDDFDTVNDSRGNSGGTSQQFQRVALTSGLPGPHFPIVPTAPVVKGRVVKQSMRRGDRPFANVSDNEDPALESSDCQDSDMNDEESYEQAMCQDEDSHYSPEYDMPMAEDEEYDEEHDEHMFVSEPGPHRSNRVEKNRAGVAYPSNIRPIANVTGSNVGSRAHPAVVRRRQEGRPSLFFNSSSENLAPSRYSGAIMPWGINQQPVLIDQETVSDAHLKKRGLKRPPPGGKIGKRSYGANDPENIAIVNMKENQGMSFAEIAEHLNSEREKQGKKPDLSVCGVNGRYNRTAPILFATQGLKFVPLSERKKAKGAAAHGKSTNKAGWTVEAENKLVDIVKQVDAEKWGHVAHLLNMELYSGRAVYDATTCARRYAAL